MAKTLTSEVVAGDAIKDFYNEEFNFESLHIENPTAGILENVDISAYPVVVDLANNKATLCSAATLNTATGIVAVRGKIESLAASGLSPQEYAVLVRGPGVLWKSGFPTSDYADAAFDLDTFETRMKLISNIVVRNGAGTITGTQTT